MKIKVEYENPVATSTVIKSEPIDNTYEITQPGNELIDVKTESGLVDQAFQQTEEKKIKWEPPGWREQLDNIYEMRKHRDAVVDTMGCDRISDVNAEPKVKFRFSDAAFPSLCTNR